ncbi:cupredoxin domain-containing protein [Halolamina sp. C58]|uniref:cupredoxin domain-containing protein n=1 Tax=Halolamina sp. C58 TaxID=3421640 RepID=UPI003EBE0873
MRVTRRQFASIAAAGTLTLAGCTGGNNDGGGQSPTETATATSSETANGAAGTSVAMVNTAFDPVRVSIDAGTTVEWVNDDGFEHDVTATQFHDSAADWSFSTTLSGGESTTFTFEEQGVYEYYCTIHGESMCGAVLVGGATLEPSLPCESGGDDGDRY